MGIPGNDRLLKLASSMGRTRDIRRPTTITDEDRKRVNDSEEVRSLVDARAKARDRCQESSGSVGRAIGTVEYTDYMTANNLVQRTREKLAQIALIDRRT